MNKYYFTIYEALLYHIIWDPGIQRFKIIYFLKGPTGHDPYGSKNTWNGPHHWCIYSLKILRFIPRTQEVSSWWFPLSFNGYMMQGMVISESLSIRVKCYITAKHLIHYAWMSCMMPATTVNEVILLVSLENKLAALLERIISKS